MQVTKAGAHRLIIGAAAAASALAVAACGSSGGGGSASPASSSPASVTLGEITDLSGVASTYGIPENHGAQIAVAQINAAGGIKSLGGAKLVIKTFDTASAPDNGTTQATAAVGDKVSAVFGGEISDTVLAGINVTQRAGVAWVDTGGTANEINQRGYSTVFQAVHDSTQFAAGWLNVAKLAAQRLGLSHPTVAVAYSQSSYGQDFLNAFKAADKSGGLKVVTTFGYPLTTTDFSSVAARLAASPADMILDLGYPGDGLSLARLFATQFKPKAKVILAAGSDAADVVSQLKTHADGVNVLGDLAPGVKGLPASFASFYQLYLARFHAVPNSQSLNGYIAVRFIAAALEKAKSGAPAAVTKALGGATLTHASGNIFPEPATLSFASNGTLAVAPFYAAQVAGGAAKIIYPAAVAETTIKAYGG
jgi:branched-chain amino acid transport system substrate-binding protein